MPIVKKPRAKKPPNPFILQREDNAYGKVTPELLKHLDNFIKGFNTGKFGIFKFNDDKLYRVDLPNRVGFLPDDFKTATNVTELKTLCLMLFNGGENYKISKKDLTIHNLNHVCLSRGLKDLTKLPFKFSVCNDSFNIANNQLTTLEGCPETVGLNADNYYGENYFDCSQNQIVNLVGGPIKVKGDYNAKNNPNLNSLEGLATEIGGNLILSGCPKLPRTRAEILKEVRKYNIAIGPDFIITGRK